MLGRAREDFVTEFDLLFVDSALRSLEGDEALVEQHELVEHLAGLPGGVVARNPPQGLLAFDHEDRNIGRRYDEARDHKADNNFDRT